LVVVLLAACGSDDESAGASGSGGSSGGGAAGAAGSGAAAGIGGGAGDSGAAGSAGVSGAAGASGAAGSGGQPWDPRFDAFAEALQDDLADSDAFGVSAAVLEDGEVTFAAAFGSKDPDGHEPLETTTLMQIGSTTKQMTAVALLRNVEAGQVSLDDSLSSALPDLSFSVDPTWSDQVLVRHLLTHQGAFYDYTPWDRTSDDADLASFAYGGFAAQEFLMAPPGVMFNYSNPNFILAGLISEELDSRMWPDIMVEDVFQPLGMTRTFLRRSEVEADGDYALSYGVGSDSLQTNTPGNVAMDQVPDPAFTRPAGLAWTTPTQMMAWAQFLMEGDPSVLSDTLRQQVTSPHVETLMLPGHHLYGFGMFVWDGYATQDATWYEVPVWEHGGNTLSFSNVFFMLPDQDFAVVITSSGFVTDFSESVDAAVTTLADLPAPSDPPSYPIDPATFDRHVGTYHDDYNVGDIIVTKQGDELFVEMPLLDQAGLTVEPELEASTNDIFVCTIDGTELELTFISEDPGGESVYVRNRLFVGTRAGGKKTMSGAVPNAAGAKRWFEQAQRLVPTPLSRVQRIRLAK